MMTLLHQTRSLQLLLLLTLYCDYSYYFGSVWMYQCVLVGAAVVDNAEDVIVEDGGGGGGDTTTMETSSQCNTNPTTTITTASPPPPLPILEVNDSITDETNLLSQRHDLDRLEQLQQQSIFAKDETTTTSSSNTMGSMDDDDNDMTSYDVTTTLDKPPEVVVEWNRDNEYDNDSDSEHFEETTTTMKSDGSSSSLSNDDNNNNNNNNTDKEFSNTKKSSTTTDVHPTGTSTSKDSNLSSSTTTTTSARDAATLLLQQPQVDGDDDDDDRSLLDIFAESAQEYLTQRMIPPTDNDCKWDWRSLQCESHCYCSFQWQWGDYHVGRACRRRHPHDPSTFTKSSSRPSSSSRKEEKDVNEEATMICVPTIYIIDQPIPKRFVSLVVQTTDIVSTKVRRRIKSLIRKVQDRYRIMQQQHICLELYSQLRQQQQIGTTTNEETNKCWIQGVPESFTIWEQLFCNGRHLQNTIPICSSDTNQQAATPLQEHAQL